jgi:hypothetical protein
MIKMQSRARHGLALLPFPDTTNRAKVDSKSKRVFVIILDMSGWGCIMKAVVV